MTQELVDLKRCIKKYREIDDDLRNLNKKVYDKRDERKSVELEITEIIKSPTFDNFRKMKLEEDGSTIQIQRPGEYSKPWSLSQKELMVLVTAYFQDTQTPNAEGLTNFIIQKRKQDLIATDFNLTRSVPE